MLFSFLFFSFLFFSFLFFSFLFFSFLFFSFFIYFFFFFSGFVLKCMLKPYLEEAKELIQPLVKFGSKLSEKKVEMLMSMTHEVF